MSTEGLQEWRFRFGLCATRDGQLISRSKCDELMDVIVNWAEANDLGVGGGYRGFSDEEKKPFKLKPED